MKKTASSVATHPPKIALALSGGGVRAMAFHSGVLRYLAEHGKLEAVSDISTVSGGSLLVGLVFARSGMVWPSSADYLAKVLPQVRQTLTTYNLQTRAAVRLLCWPSNWRFIFSRKRFRQVGISHTAWPTCLCIRYGRSTAQQPKPENVFASKVPTSEIMSLAMLVR